MRFSTPYVLYSSLRAPVDGQVDSHVEGYNRLLEAVRDDNYDFDAASAMDVIGFNNLPIRVEP